MHFRETLHLSFEALSLDTASPSRVTDPTTWGWVCRLAGGSSGSALLDLIRLFCLAELLGVTGPSFVFGFSFASGSSFASGPSFTCGWIQITSSLRGNPGGFEGGSWGLSSFLTSGSPGSPPPLGSMGLGSLGAPLGAEGAGGSG